MEYTILILLLPLLSFLFLGLAGMKLKPAAAGLVGTAVLGVVTLLSCCTAFEYFTAGRDAAGRLACLLAARADCVVQMFCGIPTVLKGELPTC